MLSAEIIDIKTEFNKVILAIKIYDRRSALEQLSCELSMRVYLYPSDSVVWKPTTIIDTSIGSISEDRITINNIETNSDLVVSIPQPEGQSQNYYITTGLCSGDRMMMSSTVQFAPYSYSLP